MRRADEAYRPSAVAHQPAPLSTVLNQEHDRAPEHRPSLPSLHAAGLNGIGPGAAKREGPQPEQDVRPIEIDGEQAAPEAVVPRPEEPAARKMDIDENYDDDSAEEMKQGSAAASGRGSRASQRSVRDANPPHETNGVAAEQPESAATTA